MVMTMQNATNSEREKRILDAAANLFTHYGFDKTTVSDIAREAGISKGAIYLHYKSKDELFEALLLREMAVYAETWIANIEADPQGGTIGGMYKNMLGALNSSAFMTAVFKQDGRILGNYMRKPDNLFKQQQFKGTRQEFVQMMQDAGLVRADLDPHVTAHIMNMLAFGLVSMEEVMDKADIPPAEAIINGIADFMDRAMSPDGGTDSAAGKAIIKQLAESSRQQLANIQQPTTNNQ